MTKQILFLICLLFFIESSWATNISESKQEKCIEDHCYPKNHKGLEQCISNSCYPCFLDIMQYGIVTTENQSILSLALHWAAKNNQTKIITYLLEEKADINALSEYKKSPLFYAVIEEGIEASLLLLEKGAYCDLRNRFGETPLHLMAHHGLLEPLKLALKKHGNINDKSYGGLTCLFYACYSNHKEIVMYLLKKGAALHAQCNNITNDSDITCGIGDTELHVVIRKNYWEIAELLLENGANICIENRNLKTPLCHYFERLREAKKHPKLGESLRRFLKSANPREIQIIFLSAICFDNKEFVKLALRHGADVNTRTSDNRGTVELAIKNESFEALKILINYGAPIPYEGCKEKSFMHTLANSSGKIAFFFSDYPFCLTFQIIKT